MSRSLRFLTVAGVLLSLVVFVMACSDDDKKPTTPTDTTPPSAISTLATGAVTSSSVVLSWTSPGDDNATGTAKQYDVRVSTATITEANFAAASQVTGEPTPTAAGSSQTMTVSALYANTPYYFAMKAADEAANSSAISNVAQATTAVSNDTTKPTAIANLATGAVTPSSIVLTWTATGDDGSTGTAFQYDIRYSTAMITDGNFATATLVTGEPAPGAAGAAQTMTVTGLLANTPYYFAAKASDEVPNWSDLSNVPTGTTSNTVDTTKPAAITNLAGTAVSGSEVDLTWTAPGDDGATGTAHEYDIRYSTSTITAGNFNSASQVSDEPTPAVAGTLQGVAVTGLTADTPYYFAIKTEDEASNTSDISNVRQVRTLVTSSAPPTLTVPDFPDTVCITSSDQYAMIAEAMIQGQLFLANWAAILSSALLAPLQAATWDQTGNCWDYAYTYAGCTWAYNVCLTGTEYEYTVAFDGPCGGDVYDNWVAFRAVVDYTVRSGSYYMYDTNTTNIMSAWLSTWAADQNSGTTTFYDGDPLSAPISSTISWSRSADHNTYDVTYIVPESDKWESHLVQNPCSGLVRGYFWDSDTQAWWKETEISWSDANTGYWDTYDQTGAVIEHHEW
jgi:hypothetical protein